MSEHKKVWAGKLAHIKNMNIKLIKGTVVNGKGEKEGSVLTVSGRDARLLIDMKKAIEYIPKPKTTRKSKDV